MNEAGYSILLVALLVITGASYLVRVLRSGRARFERTDKHGGSAMLSKRFTEMGYWALQPIARAMIALGIRPNAITWMSGVLGVGAAFALSQGRFGIGAVLALASNFCDILDGLVARAMKMASDVGEVLDAAIDRWSDFLFLAGLVYFYRGDPVLLTMTLAAMGGSFMISYATAKAEALRVEPPRTAMRRPERSVYLVAGAALTPLSVKLLEVPPRFVAPIGLPMVVAIGVVALVSIVASIRAFVTITGRVRVREAAERKIAGLADERAEPQALDAKAKPSSAGGE